MSKIDPRVAVLILGYNDRENLQGVLSSVIQQSYTNFKIFFIDNASQDNSVEYVKNNFTNVEVIENEQNVGYAGAYARVISDVFKKDFDAVILLNSDVRVDEKWL